MASIIICMSGCVMQHDSNEEVNTLVKLSLNEMLFYPERLRDSTFKPQYKYVVYSDSAECSSCRISHLGIWNYFRNSLYDNNAGLYIIFSPPKEMIPNMQKVHDSYKHRIPIYIDTLGVFMRDNPQIAGKTSKFHCFLLDENNKIVVIGDVSKNHNVRDEIFRILEKNADSTVIENHP